MNVQEFQRITPIAAAALFTVALLTVLVALWTLRRGRRDSMFIFRRATIQRGARLLMLGLFMMFMSGLVCGSNVVIGLVLSRAETPVPVALLDETATPTETETVTATASPTFTPIDTASPTIIIPTNAPLATDLPTETPTSTLSATPTASMTPTRDPSVTPALTETITFTETPAETGTLTPTLTPSPEVRLAVVQSSVTPPANARLQITALDTQVSGNSSPPAASTAFPAGFNRIYYFVTYADMGPGMLWRGTLSHDGAIINRFERQWGTAVSGIAYFFFASESGFQPGDYEIRLYFGASETPIAFKVVPAQ
jgi:hypothetical protein